MSMRMTRIGAEPRPAIVMTHTVVATPTVTMNLLQIASRLVWSSPNLDHEQEARFAGDS